MRFKFRMTSSWCVFAMFIGLGLGVGINEQQPIRHVHAPGCREVLLGQIVAPAEQGQHRPDQIALGRGFVRLAGMGKARQDIGQRRAHGGTVNRLELSGIGYAFAKVILGEQRTGCEQSWVNHRTGLPCHPAAAKIFLNH